MYVRQLMSTMVISTESRTFTIYHSRHKETEKETEEEE